MSLADLTAHLPFFKKPPQVEYFFALNIGSEILDVALWAIDTGKLKIVSQTSSEYGGVKDLTEVADKLLDQVLGELPYEPQKILFGVPDSWLQDDNLKDANLKILRSLVKELELTPMAYVATSHALLHFLENQEGAPVTAILVGVGQEEVEVIVSRAGKLDGTKAVKRSDNLGEDVQKGLLMFSEVEVLPSRILIYGDNLEKHKNQLLSFPWMNKLSFLHLPKIEALEEGVVIRAVSFAGAVEIDSSVKVESLIPPPKSSSLNTFEAEEEQPKRKTKSTKNEDLGFMAGDVMEGAGESMSQSVSESEDSETLTHHDTDTLEDVAPSQSVVVSPDREVTDEGMEERGLAGRLPVSLSSFKLGGKKFLLAPLLILLLLVLGFLFLVKATVTVYVEPKILEKDTQVTADPKVKSVDEQNKVIPGEVVEVSVSGSDKISTSGKKSVGDPAKGSVTVYNKTNDSKTFSKGVTLQGPNNLKFTLDSSVTIASESAVEGGISYGKGSGSVTAQEIGPDSNLPSGTELSVAGQSSSSFSAKAEGNFSGGTSKEVTVVTDTDQKKLLAQLSASLRIQAQQQLQGKLNGKKILEEALLEDITKKTYSKNVNDQTGEVSLNLTINYKGTAYSNSDLKVIVSKLVTTEVPGDFELNLAETETQADVSKLEKDGRLIFLARFKAKLVPKLDTSQIKKLILGKTPSQAADQLKSVENILGSDIQIKPPLPAFLQRLPLLEKNIQIEVSLK